MVNNKNKKASGFFKSSSSKPKVYKPEDEKDVKNKDKYTIKAPEKKLLGKPVLNAKISLDEDNTYTISYVLESKLKIDGKNTIKNEIYFTEKFYDIPEESIEEFSDVRSKLEEFADENKASVGEVIHEGCIAEIEGTWNLSV